MTTVEIILIIVGIILTVSGFGLILLDKLNYIVLPILLMAVGFTMIMLTAMNYKMDTTTAQKDEIIIVITDKNKTSHYVGIPGKGGHTQINRYIYFDDGGVQKLKVDSTLYNTYNVGDTIYLTKTYIYNIDRNTKEILGLREIEYNY